METLFDNSGLSGAMISKCGKYRYSLFRVWDEDKPIAAFIMLNPSKADAKENDPTLTKIIKIIKIAKNNGFGSLWVVNLFALRSKDPKVLESSQDPIGIENNKHISAVRSLPQCTVIFAWGAHKMAKEREDYIFKMFPNAMALHINKNGSPKHPLYCKDSTKLIQFKPKNNKTNARRNN